MGKTRGVPIQDQPNAGTSTFRERPGDINRKGRPPRKDFKKRVAEILEGTGEMTVPAGDVKYIHKDGSVTIKLPTLDAAAINYVNMLLKDSGDGLRALIDLQDRQYGKPRQTVGFESSLPEPINLLPEPPKHLKNDE